MQCDKHWSRSWLLRAVCAIGLPAAAGAGGCAGDGEALERVTDSKTAALSSDVRLIDAPSPPAVVLHWEGSQDGREAQAQLAFTVENTTDRAFDVDINVTSRSGSRAGSLSPSRVHLKPRSSVAHTVAIDQLGLQLVGDSASTLITAVYSDVDGVQRASALPTVWVEHEAGFRRARVRSPIAEARSNAALGLTKLRSKVPSAARVRDAAAGQLTSIMGAASDTSLRGGWLVAQPQGLPNPAEARAAASPVPSGAAPEVDDAALPAASAVSDAVFDKGGNYKVCFKLPYWYIDSLFGEDQLIAQTATAEGYEPARYMLAALTNSANTIIWSGNLDTAGCTPNVNHANGSYVGWVTTSIYRASSDVLIDVTVDDSKTFSWGGLAYSISGSGGTKTLTFTGAWSLTDAAVAAQNTLFRSTSGWPNGTRTDIFTDQDCPGIPGSGCNSGSQIWLGTNQSGFPNAGFKVVTQHELGHRVQGALMGLPENDYTIDSSAAACRCDHVVSSNSLHCLQSRHASSAAQVEGWGQFYAADNLNVGSQSNCTFVYYKEFRNDSGTVTNPPMAKSCFSKVKWMANHCADRANRGTEYDWMNFYWRVKNKDSYSFTDFQNLYRRACGGGSCAGVDVTWSATSAAAVAVFGSGSAKATAWATQGDLFGVNF